MANGNDSPILELRNITKRFGNLVAVNDVSLSLERGKLVTFLGPSGCGKTTLLRTISGFTEPDEGIVVLDGQVITGIPPNDRDTAMVFQNYALFPHMTVAQNIGFGLRIRKRPKTEIDAEVERLLDLVRECKNILEDDKRFDMPGFQPSDHYVRNMRGYGVLPRSHGREATRIDPYEVDQAYWRSFWHKPVNISAN